MSHVLVVYWSEMSIFPAHFIHQAIIWYNFCLVIFPDLIYEFILMMKTKTLTLINTFPVSWVILLQNFSLLCSKTLSCIPACFLLQSILSVLLDIHKCWRSVTCFSSTLSDIFDLIHQRACLALINVHHLLWLFTLQLGTGQEEHQYGVV